MYTDQKLEYEKYKQYFQSLKPVVNKFKTRGYTTIVLSFLAISLFGWYAIRPTLQTILYLRREIKDLTQVDRQMEEKITNLIEIQAKYQAIQKKLQLAETAMPDIPNALNISSQIKSIANTTEASISALQIAATPLFNTKKEKVIESKKESNLEQIPISLIVTGPFSNVSNLLDTITELKRLISIESLLITPISTRYDTNSSKTIQFSVKLMTYYLSY